MRKVRTFVEFFNRENPQPRIVWEDEVDLDSIASAEGRRRFVMDSLLDLAFHWASEHWEDQNQAKWEYMKQDGPSPDMVNIFISSTWIGTFKLIICGGP
jgi:hypothetical protein